MDSKQHRFDALVGALADDVFRYAYWLCGERPLAEDLTQETLLRAWRFMDSLKDAGAIKAWLITTLRREHARLYERKRFDYADVDWQSLADEHSDGPEADAERAALHRHIQALPANHREPLALQVLLGFSVREIATALEISESAVMARLFRARKRLFDSLTGSAADARLSL